MQYYGDTLVNKISKVPDLMELKLWRRRQIINKEKNSDAIAGGNK